MRWNSKALALAALALASPAEAMRYTSADELSVNVITLPAQVPWFPGDLVVCEEDDAPGHDCNCVDGDEDTCTPIAWRSCGTDTDCEIRSRSPYGWQPRR
jgi:hypothetical protein